MSIFNTTAQKTKGCFPSSLVGLSPPPPPPTTRGGSTRTSTLNKSIRKIFLKYKETLRGVPLLHIKGKIPDYRENFLRGQGKSSSILASVHPRQNVTSEEGGGGGVGLEWYGMASLLPENHPTGVNTAPNLLKYIFIPDNKCLINNRHSSHVVWLF